ncbi:MAG: DUF2147 domain-containing protein [Hyphomicrobium sp.]|nr:DUF2147 domain-containing protein [Hyphomicrobium sp.]
MKQSVLIAAAFGAALSCTSSANAAGTDPTGVWLDDTGRGAIEIKPCGNGLCGYVVAVKSADDTKGCGKQIIGDAKPVSGGRWDNGWIYSPEKRKNYDVELKPMPNGTLRVVGYAGTKLFSRTMIWTQAPADLKRCDSVDAKAPAASEAAAAPVKTAPVVAATEKLAEQPKAVATTPDQTKTETANVEPTNPAPDDAGPAAKPDTTVESGEEPGERSGGQRLKIGDLDLDKVLTRTASGKCKLDLPWVKVKFDCER